MSFLNIEPLHPDFGAQITGLDLNQRLSEKTIGNIKLAIDRHSFLCFPDQSVTDDMQLAFTKLFGEPEPSHVKLGQEGIVDNFITIGNVQDDDSVLGSNHQKTRFLSGNNMWHSDSSFRTVPTYISIMCAYEVPRKGGRTEFVSQRAAYKRLPTETQISIDTLITIHDYVFSRSKISHDAVTPSHAASLPPVRQKLIRKNSCTKEKNIYIGSHAKEIEGWDFSESRVLLENLLSKTTETKHIYAHTWKPGDLVIWDNRCLLHRGSGYDADKYRRRMRQTHVKGIASTLDE